MKTPHAALSRYWTWSILLWQQIHWMWFPKCCFTLNSKLKKKTIVFEQVCAKQWNCRRNLWGCVQVYRKWISSKTVSWRDESSLEQNASVWSSQQTMAHQCKHILDPFPSQPGKKNLPKWLGPSSMRNSPVLIEGSQTKALYFLTEKSSYPLFKRSLNSPYFFRKLLALIFNLFLRNQRCLQSLEKSAKTGHRDLSVGAGYVITKRCSWQ